MCFQCIVPLVECRSLPRNFLKISPPPDTHTTSEVYGDMMATNRVYNKTIKSPCQTLGSASLGTLDKYRCLVEVSWKNGHYAFCMARIIMKFEI